MYSCSKLELEYIITHVVLPPKLPQTDDSHSDRDAALLQQCEATLSAFQALIPFQDQSNWMSCGNMVNSMLKMRDRCGELIEEEVKLALKIMKVGGMVTTARA